MEHTERRLLVVPVGSLEQHGPHLRLDTDTRIAVAVVRRACARRPGVALAPPLPDGDTHAGRSETSLMLALAPDAVQLNAAERGDVRPLEQILPLLRERGIRAVSPNGVLGDPSGASAAEGEQLLAHLTHNLNAPWTSSSKEPDSPIRSPEAEMGCVCPRARLLGPVSPRARTRASGCGREPGGTQPTAPVR